MIRRVPITPGDLTNHQIGTDDILTGTTDTTLLYGDAGGSMLDHSIGGNDTLTERLVFNGLDPVPPPLHSTCMVTRSKTFPITRVAAMTR